MKYVSIDHWKSAGTVLSKNARDNPWLLGEWWLGGKPWSRERTEYVRNDPRWMGPDLHTLRNHASIVRKFKHSRHRDTLSVAHHEAVAGLPVAQADELLDLAAANPNRVTSKQLRMIAQRAKAFTPKPDFEPCCLDDLTQAVAEGRRFSTILADPPWRSEFATGRWSAASHYETMTLDQICAMPVRGLSAADAHLHLWCPNHLLREGLAVIDAWGFSYKTKLVWRKLGRPGTGNYYRTVTEDLLLGGRGRALRFADQSTVNYIETPRGRHSEKPALHEMIARCSPGPYLELFARSIAQGWSAWGDQVSVREFANDIQMGHPSKPETCLASAGQHTKL
jgi:N6-adenosine-specific RNA methylase IME4